MLGWDDEDAALMIAAQQLRADIGPHGHPMSEAMSPLAGGRGPGTYHYEAHVKRDYAAAELANRKRERANRYKDADLSSDVWVVERHWNDDGTGVGS